MIIDRFIGEASRKTNEIVADFFLGYNQVLYGIPGKNDLIFADEIRDILKRYTTNKEIIFNIPYEIESLTNTLINSMYYTSVISKLDIKDVVSFISRLIEQHFQNSRLILKELEQEINFQNYKV